MDVIVCIKQVPDTTDIKIDPETHTLIREGVEAIINPFDTYAIEEGLRIKEKLTGKLTVITMGPAQAESALREAISLGADEAILISDRAFAGSDTWATSYILAKAIEEVAKFDLIICGKQAIDGDTAQVGPGISTHLDIPQVTYVKKIREIKKDYAIVERMTEEGFEVIKTPLPALFTVVKEINEPRLPSLKGKIRAKKAEIKRYRSEDLNLDLEKIGLSGSPTQVVKIFSPELRKKGQILTGATQEVVEKLVSLIKSEIR
jgi:electron transfer flavoprotein beta subunit